MRTTIAAAVALALLLLPAAAGAQQPEQETIDPPRATAAVQVTQNPEPGRLHAAPVIAVHPQTGELAIAETEFRRTMRCNVHISVDDGESWSRGGDPTREPYTDCGSDPVSTNNLWLAYAPDGVLHYAFTAGDPQFNDRPKGDRPRSVFLARSDDGGRTFDTTTVYEAPEELDEDDGSNLNRRVRVAIDPNDASRVYVSWQQSGDAGEGAKALVAASDDGGATFADPVNVADERGAYHARLAIDGEGTVHVAIPTLGFTTDEDETLTRAVDYRRSTDRGQSWSDPVELSEGYEGFRLGRKWELAADPKSSTLYATWYGSPRTDVDDVEADRDILMFVSEDSGDTWSDVRVVNDDADQDLVQHYDPLVAIAPSGRLDIAWYDFRNSPYPEGPIGEPGSNEGGFHDVYYTHSEDRGATFAENMRVTDRIINREIGVWSNNVHIHGHVGVASTDDTVYFAWQDTRNGDPEFQSEDVYFAKMRLGEPVAATAGVSGVPLWAGLGAALVLGMGVSMAIAGYLARRRPA